MGSWRLHAAWGRAELPARAPPFAAMLVYALAQLALQWGWADTSLLLVLGFHTVARSGELFAARAGDFVLDNKKGSWTLPLWKSGQRSGATEPLMLSDPFVIRAVQNYIQSLPETSCV